MAEDKGCDIDFYCWDAWLIGIDVYFYGFVAEGGDVEANNFLHDGALLIPGR